VAKSSKDKNTNKMENLKNKVTAVVTVPGAINSKPKIIFIKNALKINYALIASITLIAIGGFQPLNGFAQAQSTVRDGRHDFDFCVGKWKTHISQLINPLSHFNDWVKLEGDVTIRSIGDGKGFLEEIEVVNASVHFNAITLFLYDPKAGQWSETFTNLSSGVPEIPKIGEFKDGVAEMYATKTFNGRAILVRGKWSNITANTHTYEEAFSEDGGKTWETNLIANEERVSQ
jgi:hypothetical protein